MSNEPLDIIQVIRDGILPTHVVDLPLSTILLADDIQVRVQLRDATVDDYAHLLADEVVFPAVDVFTDGNHFWLASGFHRYAAHKRVGGTIIRAKLHEGDKRAARLFACQANSTHGLPMSRADKQRAVGLMLDDPEWQYWTDRHIAKHIGVSHTFVANERRERAARGNVAIPARVPDLARPSTPAYQPDQVLDYQDAPNQPNQTTLGSPVTMSVGFPVSSSHRDTGSQQRYAPQRYAPLQPAMVSGITIAWDYADHDGHAIQGTCSLAAAGTGELPETIRQAMLRVLGSDYGAR